MPDIKQQIKDEIADNTTSYRETLVYRALLKIMNDLEELKDINT